MPAGFANLDNITAALGAYCREHNDTVTVLPIIGLDAEMTGRGVTMFNNIVDEMPLLSSTTKHVLQPATNPDFTPLANPVVDFDVRILKVESYKADIKIEPDKHRQNWLSHNLNGQAIYKEWEDVPFAQFIMDRTMMQVQADLREAIWKGVKTGVATANPFLDWGDGFIKRVKVAKAASTIPTVTLGAITQANSLAKVESFADAISDNMEDQAGFVHCPRQIYNWVMKAAPAEVNRVLDVNEVPGENGSTRKDFYIRGTNIKLVKNQFLTAGATSQLLYTMENNLFVGTDSLVKNNEVEFQKFDRYIKMMLTGALGTQFAMDSKNTTDTPMLCTEAFV